MFKHSFIGTMVMNKLLRFGKRQVQTIVSREIIKPSSPTPSHLKTYNLSVLDQTAMNAYMPIVLFYQSFGHNKNKLDLKYSLSQTLTQYYPFAGRLAKTSPTYVDCNDEGVEFIEGYNDCQLSDFLKHSKHEDMDQLFPDKRIWYNANQNAGYDENSNYNNKSSTSTGPLTVQVTRFAYGGVAVAASLSHKIADAGSLLNFLNHWATMTRSPNEASHINPHFIRHQTRSLDLPKNLPHRQHHGDYVTRSFLFPDTKINELKSKVIGMTTESAGHPIKNVTRIEALTWLLHSRLLAAASLNTKSGTFKASGVCRILGMRNNMVETLPQTTVGNIFLTTEFPTRNQSDLAPNMFISQLRKTKMEIRSITNLETVIEMVAGMCSETAIMEALDRLDDYYIYSNLYGLPTYEIDFGWGKPVKLSIGGALKNVIILMDTPNRNGIEALVSLERQEMKIIQNDHELLAFC